VNVDLKDNGGKERGGEGGREGGRTHPLVEGASVEAAIAVSKETSRLLVLMPPSFEAEGREGGREGGREERSRDQEGSVRHV